MAPYDILRLITCKPVALTCGLWLFAMRSTAFRALSLLGGLLQVLSFALTTTAKTIPPPTGKYAVGVRKHVIDFYNDQDPLAPGNVSTGFLATLFYPTTHHASTPVDEPYLDPKNAEVWENIYNFTKGSIASLTSSIQPDAPFLKYRHGCKSLYPTILFGPGAGGPVSTANAILLSDLVSHGYTVIGLDHPYEHEWLQWPNGTYVPGLPLDYAWGLPGSLDELIALYELRLKDSQFVLDNLRSVKSQLGAPINTTHVGTLGHSLGGAAAIDLLYDNDMVRSAIDLDGSLFQRPEIDGPEADTRKPSFLLGSEIHFDEGWRTYPGWQTGDFRGARINGSAHNDFSDAGFWRTVGRGKKEEEIEGERMVRLERTLVRAFFDYTLLGGEAPEVLDPPNEEYTELVFFDKDGPIES